MALALFAYLMGRTILANEQCFFLTTNQRTVLSAMAFQQSEQGLYWPFIAASTVNSLIVMVS